jgi:hypothetical protein
MPLLGIKMIEFALVVLMVIASLLVITIILLMRNLNKPITVIAPEIRDRIVPSISQFDPASPVTTVSPAPFAAMTCAHDWDIVTDQTLEMDHEKRAVVIMSCNKCGLVDKTMTVTSPVPPPPKPLPPPPPPKSECRHRWDKEKVVTLDSAYEQMSRVRVSGQKKDTKPPELDQSNLEPWMFRKIHISIRVCTQCGEIDKSIVSNLECENAIDPTEEK